VNASYGFGRIEVRPAQRQLRVDGEVVVVGARAFDTLLALIERRDRVVGSEELFELVWPGLVVEENNLRQQVSALRKLLGVEAIVTVPGRGYRFGLEGEAPAAPLTAAPVDALAATSNNLPLNLPALIGRESELAAVTELLGRTHLLTLVGSGGVGKTRFALELAAALAGRFKDGVWFVELAPVTDPTLVVPTVATVLDLHDEPGRPLLDTLLDSLRHRELLIVLDNCEHLVEACARLAERVLHASAGTRTLATSREALNVDGETAWRMPSLPTAAPDSAAAPDDLMGYAATRLFVQRASAASPGFQLTAQNAAAVAAICHHLDGIPLALELAAARVKAMRVEQVAERLGDRFALLTRGSRTALQRHQTLRSLIDWSHDLLAESERLLLRRLSVFAGGWTLEAAEAVCSDAGLERSEILDLLTHLVEKSLVVLDEPSIEPRYRMLETIRQYAAEKLAEADEIDPVRTRHLQHMVAFTAPIYRRLASDDRDRRWFALVEAELDNIRAALDRATEPGHAELGLQIYHALHRYWYQGMRWKEAVAWHERLAARSEHDGPPTIHRARALYVSAMQATNYDPPAGRRLCQQCLSLSRALGFDEGMAWALMWIGYIDTRRRDPATADLFAESLRCARRIDDPWWRGFSLMQILICQAGYEAVMGRDDAVEAVVHEAQLEIERIGGIALYSGHALALLGTLATRRGDYERADRLLGESLALYRAVDSKFDIANSLVQHGFLALRQGEARRALGLFRESLPRYRNYPMSPWATRGLAHLLIAHAACQDWTKAARLAGVLGIGDGSDRAPPELSGRVARAYLDALVDTRRALGDAAFGAEAAAGQAMTREQAIEFALGD
jgi:non-specific serine/threonine protein kinase